jgi:hypothetical protein
VRIRLDDGSERLVDHVVQGTGYQVEIERFGFLSPAIVAGIRRIGGQPRLGAGFESSIPGLHFLGWASDLSFGPLMRAIAGTSFTAHTLASRAAAELAKPGPMGWGRTMEMLEQGMQLVPNVAPATVTAAAVGGIVGPVLGVDAGPIQDMVNPPRVHG